MKLSLPNVTIVNIDCTPRWRKGLNALIYSLKDCEFGEALFLTDKHISEVAQHIQDINITHIRIEPIRNKEDYSKFCIKALFSYIKTDFLLIVQWDGYVLRSDAWLPEFLEYDYIGAPWNFYTEKQVGNGGFSLRSKRLMQFMSIQEGKAHPEDDFICRSTITDTLETNGFKIAPLEIAKKFASESYPYEGQFGWHGGSAPVH
jgi:hypothetical protein